MTEKEALEFFEGFIKTAPVNPYTQSAKLAIKALEKQISKKPKKHGYGKWYLCPDCLRLIKKRIEDSPHDIKFCPFCGQTLDWSDEK